MIQLTPKQIELIQAAWGSDNCLAYGGARAGKTFAFMRFILLACVMFPGIRVLTARQVRVDIHGSIWSDTLPKVLRESGLTLGKEYSKTEQEMEIRLFNGSAIYCDGLDDAQRIEKVLGREYGIIYINECHEVPYPTVTLLRTRLAQAVNKFSPKLLADLNPTTTAHWSYKQWFAGIDPESMGPLNLQLGTWLKVKLTPEDNRENLAEGFIERQLQTLSGLRRKRFYEGEYAEITELNVVTPVAFFTDPEFFDWVGDRKDELRFIGGLDLGFQDADAFAVLAYIPGYEETWVVYEYKSRRSEMEDLVNGIREGIAWVKANLPGMAISADNLRVQSDHGTIRYGLEGDKKKSWQELKRLYGINAFPAMKRDAAISLEHLITDLQAGRMHIRANGPLHEESEQTIWTRNPIDQAIMRVIDDKAYHPDMLHAVRYAHTWLINAGNDAMMREGPYEAPVIVSDTEQVVQDMIEVITNPQEMW